MKLFATSLTDAVCNIASGAGDVILRHYRQRAPVVEKADRSPLTQADVGSHEYLLEALGRLTPGVPIVSEESSKSEHETGSASSIYWLIDPLDGTKEFIKGTDEFAVNIALVQDSRPVLGVVMAPALGMIYTGSVGGGAWRRCRSEPPQQIRSRTADGLRLAIVGSRDHAGPKVATLLARAPGAELKSIGSSLKFCLVAEGSADLYLRDLPTMEWDTGAAQCVVEAAGGLVCDLTGEPLAYSKRELRNPSIVAVGDVQLPWKHLVN